MCKVITFLFETCGCSRIDRHHWHRHCDRDETCDGLTAIEVALPGSCNTCITPGPVAQCRRIAPLTPLELSLCDRLMANCADGSFTLQGPDGEAHSYGEEWSHPLPDQDLEWLMHFTVILEEYMWVKIEKGEIKGGPGMVFLILASHIFFAYHTALAQLILRSRMDGLHHIQLRPPPEIVREERLPVLLSRLTALAPEVPHSELKELGDEAACSICLCPLSSNTPETGPVVQLPCKHMYCKPCLEQWIISWDRESALRVCTLCNEGFGLTAIGNEPPTKKPGFEPNPEGYIPAEVLAPGLEQVVRDIASRPGSYGWDVERPWWMTLLRRAEEEASSDGPEPAEE